MYISFNLVAVVCGVLLALRVAIWGAEILWRTIGNATYKEPVHNHGPKETPAYCPRCAHDNEKAGYEMELYRNSGR